MAIRRQRPAASNEIKLSPRQTETPVILSRTPASAEGCVIPQFALTGPSSFSSSTCGSLSKVSGSRRTSGSATPNFDMRGNSSAFSDLRLERKFGASKVVPNLFLGGDDDTLSIALLKAHNITHILNVAKECGPTQELYDLCQFVGNHVPPAPACVPLLSPSVADLNTPDMMDGPMESVKTGVFPNVASLSSRSTPTDKPFKYLYLPLTDNVDTRIEQCFDEALQFMRSALVCNTGVLVHCRMGVSRSATIVVAYLMKYGMKLAEPSPVSFDIAYNRVRMVRPTVNPNLGFGQILRAYEAQLQGRNDASCSLEVQRSKALELLN